jgi:hypothetical protein
MQKTWPKVSGTWWVSCFEYDIICGILIVIVLIFSLAVHQLSCLGQHFWGEILVKPKLHSCSDKWSIMLGIWRSSWICLWTYPWSQYITMQSCFHHHYLEQAKPLNWLLAKPSEVFTLPLVFCMDPCRMAQIPWILHRMEWSQVIHFLVCYDFPIPHGSIWNSMDSKSFHMEAQSLLRPGLRPIQAQFTAVQAEHYHVRKILQSVEIELTCVSPHKGCEMHNH